MRPILHAPLCLLAGCAAARYASEADDQSYAILDVVTERVTGDAKTFPIERPEQTLRDQLLAEGGEVFLELRTALDVAAENSREFQTEKERLYLAALNLTREQHDFALRFGGGGSADTSGIGDDTADLNLSDDLSAAVNTVAGTRIVASFVTTFMRSLITGDGWNSSSIFNLTLTQPLLRGTGQRIVREPLTQAERDVVYAVRDFERFRATFAVSVISEYLEVVQDVQDLESEELNLTRAQKSTEQIQALFDANREDIEGLDRAKQNELEAEDRVVRTQNSLDSRLDRFKQTLGLPTDAVIRLDGNELDLVEQRGVTPVVIQEPLALRLALERRYDYQTVQDRVADAARRIVVSEDALRSQLDFSAVVNVPTDPDQPLDFDFSQVSWAAGFDLGLALDKLPERNAYRSALINLDAQIRQREQFEDLVKAQIRNALRDITSTIANYDIQSKQVELNARRLDAANDLYEAGRADTLAVLDAQRDLLSARLQLTAAIVNYSIARLQLLRDLEALAMEPKGLRLDFALPLPTATD